MWFLVTRQKCEFDASHVNLSQPCTVHYDIQLCNPSWRCQKKSKWVLVYYNYVFIRFKIVQGEWNYIRLSSIVNIWQGALKVQDRFKLVTYLFTKHWNYYVSQISRQKEPSCKNKTISNGSMANSKLGIERL